MAVGWVLSRMRNAARLAVLTQPTLPRRALASRAPTAVSCATRNSHQRASPAPPALVPACAAACAQAGACAMRRARWRGAPSPPIRMWAPAHEPRAYVASQGREIHHHPTSPHAGMCVRAQHAAAGGPPRATKLANSEQARLVRARPSREFRGIAPGGRKGARAVTTSEYDGKFVFFDCFRFMEPAEIGRCHASVSPPQTHQGGLLSSIGMAVAVCWGCPRCSARWGETSALVCGCTAARERASERRVSERVSGERSIERRAYEQASGAQQTVTHSDTSASVCGSQRASERAGKQAPVCRRVLHWRARERASGSCALHTATPHPEPLSEHMMRAVWRRRITRGIPRINHVTTRPASSARPALALRGGAQNHDAQGHQYVGVWEWHQYVGVCGKTAARKGRGGRGVSARRRTRCRPAEGQHVDTFPPFPRGVVYGASGGGAERVLATRACGAALIVVASCTAHGRRNSKRPLSIGAKP